MDFNRIILGPVDYFADFTGISLAARDVRGLQKQKSFPPVHTSESPRNISSQLQIGPRLSGCAPEKIYPHSQ